MKKLSFLFFVAFILVSLSCPTFALSTSYPVSNMPALSQVLKGSDGNYTFDVSLSSDLPVEKKAILQEILNVMSGGDATRSACIVINQNAGNFTLSGLYIHFYSFDKQAFSFGAWPDGSRAFTAKNCNEISFSGFTSLNFSASNYNASFLASKLISIRDMGDRNGVVIINTNGIEFPENITTVSNISKITPNIILPTSQLTIQYLYADGSKAAEPYVQPQVQGAEFSVNSPNIAGYTPDKKTVSGTMGTVDKVETVTYQPIPYTLNILYLYENRTQAFPPYTTTLKIGESFSVPTPTLEGFTPSATDIWGKIDGKDLSYTVVFFKNSTPPSSSEDSSSGSGSGDSSSGGSSSGGSQAGSEYVIWNPQIMKSGFQNITNQAGSAFNIGIWVFLMIVGIILAVKLVRGLMK